MFQLRKDNLLPRGTVIQFNADYGIEVEKGQIGMVLNHRAPVHMEVLVGEKRVDVYFWDVPLHGWIEHISVIDLDNIV